MSAEKISYQVTWESETGEHRQGFGSLQDARAFAAAAKDESDETGEVSNVKLTAYGHYRIGGQRVVRPIANIL